MSSTPPIRLVIIEDSNAFRHMLKSVFASCPDIEVVGEAASAREGRDQIVKLRPDVITLDIEMPGMRGDEFLQRLMAQHPMPVIVVSGLAAHDPAVAARTRAAGAGAVVGKPGAATGMNREAFSDCLRQHVRRLASRPGRASGVGDRVAAARPTAAVPVESVIAIGASTGGTEAVGVVLAGLPADSPPVVLVQHMPAYGMKSIVEQWNQRSPMNVRIVEESTPLQPGTVYVAAGDRHLELRGGNGKYVARPREGEPVSGHCPSIDVLFQSVARSNVSAIGVILTGMGEDGAEGLLAMRRAGAHTIGQDEATSMVYGMPKVARRVGAVVAELPLDAIAAAIAKGAARSAA